MSVCGLSVHWSTQKFTPTNSLERLFKIPKWTFCCMDLLKGEEKADATTVITTGQQAHFWGPRMRKLKNPCEYVQPFFTCRAMPNRHLKMCTFWDHRPINPLCHWPVNQNNSFINPLPPKLVVMHFFHDSSTHKKLVNHLPAAMHHNRDQAFSRNIPSNPCLSLFDLNTCCFILHICVRTQTITTSSRNHAHHISSVLSVSGTPSTLVTFWKNRTWRP